VLSITFGCGMRSSLILFSFSLRLFYKIILSYLYNKMQTQRMEKIQQKSLN
jgi:hypothetical protein